MNRLTKKSNSVLEAIEYQLIDEKENLSANEGIKKIPVLATNKLGKLEDIEEALGIDLIILFKASSFGFYCKENNEIKYKRLGVIIVGKYLIETKPVYAVKEITLNSSYYGDVESMKKVDDAHYWDWKTCKHWEIKDYGKTWALTKEELEDDN